MSLYQYVSSNPFNRRDPLGLGQLLDTLSANAMSLYMRGSMFAAAHPTAMAICGGVVAAANLYMMATDPEFLALAMSQPGGYGLLQADLYALTRAGGAIKGLVKGGGQALRWLAPAAGFRLFTEAEEWLAQCFGGRSQQFFKTSRGLRVVDQLADRVAHEAKMGYVAWSSRILEQIRRDVAISKEFPDKVEKVCWHFFRSANTGKIGADARVLAELAKNNIRYIIYGE